MQVGQGAPTPDLSGVEAAFRQVAEKYGGLEKRVAKVSECVSADRKAASENIQRQKGIFGQVGTEERRIKQVLEKNRRRAPPLGADHGGATLARLEALQRSIRA